MEEILKEKLENEEEESTCGFNFIGKTPYLYSMPYVIDKEKFKNHLHLQKSFFTRAFGIDIEEVKKLDTVSFFISKYNFYGEPSWEIHSHWWYDDWEKESQNTFNPPLTDENGKTLNFKSKEECETFLIKLLKDSVIKVNSKHYDNEIKELNKEINRLESIKLRMKIGITYINDPFRTPDNED